MRQRAARAALAVAIVLSMGVTACDREDERDLREVGDEVEKGAESVGQEVEEGVDELDTDGQDD